VLEGHTDWVRDVAWAPNIGFPRSYIVTTSQDKSVIIWTKGKLTLPWAKATLGPSVSAVSAPASAGGPAVKGGFPDAV